MGDEVITAGVTIITAIIGVAILAVLVSKQSNTAQVISAGTGGLSSLLQTALSPISGGGFASNGINPITSLGFGTIN